MEDQDDILDQMKGTDVNYEVIRGSLWGLAHHPMRLVEFHENIALTLKICWEHFVEKNDGIAARDVFDTMWMILRKERLVNISYRVPSKEIADRAAAQGDDEPARRRRRLKGKMMASKLPGGFGGPGFASAPDPKRLKRDHDAEDVETCDPEIASEYIASPVARIALDLYPAEMLSRSDPFLRLMM